jgi:hypothetical protein
VNPEIRQNGRSTRNVKTIPVRKEGVSPGFRKSLDNNSIRIMEKRGPVENSRLIFLISVKDDRGAKPDPAAEPISHEQRKAPAISS